MAQYDFNLIVIGGGGAGITSAMMARGLGKRTAMVDRKKFGGECTWTGCVPSKALLRSAEVARLFGEAGRYGLETAGVLGHDGVMESVRGVVKQVYEGEGSPHFRKLGITAIEDAEISFIDSHTVYINGTSMTSDKFIICTGSGPLVPPIPGLDTAGYHTNETIFSIDAIPSSMIILGGGPIGMELATAFSALGTAVTVVEMAPTILPREDAEMAGLLEQKIQETGVTILTGTKARAAGQSGKGVFMEIETGGEGLDTDS